MSIDTKLPVIALWSGGFDSTFMIANLLKEGRKVEAVSIDAFVTGKRKVMMEDSARNSLKSHLISIANKYNGVISFSSMKIDIPVMAFSNTPSSECVCDDSNVVVESILGKVQLDVQPVLWAGNLANILVYATDNCEIAIGYHADTSYSSAKQYVSDIISNMGNTLGKKFSVVYPLKYMHKADMLVRMYLEDDFRFILESAYSCEGDRGVHCGTCGPCIRLRNNFISIVLNRCFGYDIHQYFAKKLLEWFNVVVNEAVTKSADIESTEVRNIESEVDSTCLLCGASFSSEHQSDCLCSRCRNLLSHKNREE